MDELPDEVLQIILSFLPVKKRFRLEVVSRRWQRSMPYGPMRNLDLLQALFPDGGTRIDKLPITGALSCLLERCGKQVHKISFGDAYLLVTPTAIALIDSNCPNLEELDLSFCTVTENIVPAILELSDRLKRLTLRNTCFSIRDADAHRDNVRILFHNLYKLEGIDLQKTSVHNLPALPFLPPTLKSINLNQCSPLKPQILMDFLVTCPDLEELRLSAYSNLDDDLLEVIVGMRNLRILELSHVAFSDLMTHRNLSELDLTTLCHLTQLTELHLQYNSAVTDLVLDKLSVCCGELRILNLSYDRRITDFTPLARFRKLNSLSIAATERFGDKELEMLTVNGRLSCLRAAACSHLGARGIETLIKSSCGAKITEVNISGRQWDADSVNDRLLIEILSYCVSLECLVLQGCELLTDDCFIKLEKENRKTRIPSKLRVVDLSYCNQMSDEGILAFSRIVEADIGRRTPSQLTFYAHQTKATRSVFAKVSSALKLVL